MICPLCGTRASNSADYCPQCNYRLSSVLSSRLTSITVSSSLKWLVGIALILVIAPIGTALIVADVQLTRSQCYQQALKIAQASPAVRDLLGDNIKPEWPAFGGLSNHEGSDFAQWTVPVKGPKGKGRLNAVANGVFGEWEFSRLTFVPDNGAAKIDLTPPPRRLTIAHVPAKTVYLVPLDLSPEDSLAWAPSYFQAKLGIEVKMLPGITLSTAAETGSHRQLSAEKCVDLLLHSYQELSDEPSAILVGVTSRDMTIVSYGWDFAENYRVGGRLAIVSSARIRPPRLLGDRNPEWRISRLQKMIVKNVAMMYFDLPLSSSPTSLVSAGVLSGDEVDLMAGRLVGSQDIVDTFLTEGDPGVTVYDVPGRTPLWRMTITADAMPNTSSQVFSTDLGIGLFVQRKPDFRLAGDPRLNFTRLSRNQDPRARQFGIGAMDSLDIFLVGEMGNYVDLVFEGGGRVHYQHVPAQPGQSGERYQAGPRAGVFSDSVALYRANNTTVIRKDGWTYFFPYLARALPAQVTVLTGFSDPSGRKYEMKRNDFGDLLSLTTPSGDWLHFESDEQHRYKHIADSHGREVTYEYDARGYLSRATDNAGNVDRYTYDDHGNMLTAAHGDDSPVITNEYESNDHIKSQTIAGVGKFEFNYVQDSMARGHSLIPNMIIDPDGLQTFINYVGSRYQQSLRRPPP